MSVPLSKLVRFITSLIFVFIGAWGADDTNELDHYHDGSLRVQSTNKSQVEDPDVTSRVGILPKLLCKESGKI